MDYELLTDDHGMRVVKFGTFAGYAGMIDTMCGLGQRLLGLGQSSPFLVWDLTTTLLPEYEIGKTQSGPSPLPLRTLACHTAIPP